jgi:hypothetical protein
MSALTIVALVVPLLGLGTIASRIGNPPKASQDGSFEDKPMWTSWIENVVQAFVARRSENELGHNRQDETQNPKVGSEKVVDPQQVPLQALTQQDLLLSQRHELDLQQSAIASAVSRIPQQNRVHPEDIDSGPRIMDMLRTYLGPVMQYPSSSHIQTYAGNRGLPSDQWHDSDRFQPRAKSIDPDLTDRRRMPQEALLPGGMDFPQKVLAIFPLLDKEVPSPMLRPLPAQDNRTSLISHVNLLTEKIPPETPAKRRTTFAEGTPLIVRQSRLRTGIDPGILQTIDVGTRADMRKDIRKSLNRDRGT